MLALGIDPGTAIVGYGLVRENPDGSLQAVQYGVFRTPSEDPMPKRLAHIHSEIKRMAKTFKPDIAAVEELFFAKNVTTAITVAQGRGVILMTLETLGIPIYEYKPNFVKQSVTGYGGAEKPQMQEMVRMLLGLEMIPKPDDAADGLAIAIVALQHRHYHDLQDNQE
jgi:crossover junction endodeoxyribonuclease RuvC